MTDRQYDAYVACVLDGKRGKDYAAELGVSPAAVSKLLRKYKTKMGIARFRVAHKNKRANPRFAHLSTLVFAA